MSSEAAYLVDPTDGHFLADPYPAYEALRRETFVPRHPGGFYLVGRYADVVDVLHNSQLFSSHLMSGGQPEGLDEESSRRLQTIQGRRGGLLPVDASLIGSDPPRHAHLRSIVARGFTPRRVRGLTCRIEAIVDELMGRFLAEGSCDLVEALAAPLAITVIADLLGIDRGRCADLRRWSSILQMWATSGGSGSQDDLVDQMLSFQTFMLEMIERRRSRPGDDLISVLVRAQAGGADLDDTDLLSFAILLLQAGTDNTINLIGNAVISLLEHPEQLREVQASPGRSSAAVEETLRFESPVQMVARMTTRDVEIRGTRIPADSMVIAMLASANRDEAKFPQAHRFDLSRSTDGHLGFGVGDHFCLGAALARSEARVAIEAVATRLRNVEAREAPIPRLGSFLLRGPKRLLVSFDPVPERQRG